MGGKGDLGVIHDPLALKRLGSENIQSSASQLTGVKGVAKGFFANQSAAGGIDYVSRGLHKGKQLSVDNRLAVGGSGNMEGNEVGVLKDLFLAHEGVLIKAGNGADDVGINNLHAESRSPLCKSPGDTAHADKTQRLAVKLNAFILLFIPLAVAHGVVGDADETGKGQHMAQSQLGNRLGGSLGGIGDLYTVGLGILDIDIVNADAAADNQLQVAALGLVYDILTDLGLGPYNDDIKVPEGLAQLLRLIEMLD